MIQLRELQNLIGQNRPTGIGSPHSSSEGGISGSLWDLIQLVGERARRNTVLLMDRDNAEVFYSKVSDLKELFYCLDKQLGYIISTEMPLVVQIQRACELSNACVTLIRAATQYRNEYHMWYPSLEGLTPWYCQPVVRSGLWSIASFMLQLLNEISHLDMSRKSDFFSNLEVLAEVLLEAYSGAITAKVERKEEQKGLLDEYWNRRDALLDSLYQLVKSSVETSYQVNLVLFNVYCCYPGCEFVYIRNLPSSINNYDFCSCQSNPCVDVFLLDYFGTSSQIWLAYTTVICAPILFELVGPVLLEVVELVGKFTLVDFWLD